MQLGARWRVGDAPHRGVPDTLHAAIAESERLHPSGTAWTLTWLEGRPRVELCDEAGERLDDVRIDAAGRVTRSTIHAPLDDDNDAAGESGADDDDDWLM